MRKSRNKRTPSAPDRSPRATPARRWPPDADTLDAMIAEATVDANGEEERAVGMFTALEEALEVPFETDILGVAAIVERLDLSDDGVIVARCRRGRVTQTISVLALRLASPRPVGAEWIEAYRRMVRWR